MSFYRQMSNAGIELVRILQSSPRLRVALAALRSGWREDAFVHHDLKWDNCLLLPAGASVAIFELWENAQVGELAAFGVIWTVILVSIAVIYYLFARRYGVQQS